MIETAIVNYLKSDDPLCDLLAPFNGAAAIFTHDAPETATIPYLVATFKRGAPEDGIQPISFTVSLYDTDKSSVNARAAVERIEFILDRKLIQSDRYSDIRIWLDPCDDVECVDPRDIFHTLQFTARGTRKKWLNETRV
jgi:hypothetical protein